MLPPRHAPPTLSHTKNASTCLSTHAQVMLMKTGSCWTTSSCHREQQAARTTQSRGAALAAAQEAARAPSSGAALHVSISPSLQHHPLSHAPPTRILASTPDRSHLPCVDPVCLHTCCVRRGVSFNEKSKRWHASIVSSGKLLRIGVFTNEEEAAHHFDRAAIKLRGRKTQLNYEYAGGCVVVGSMWVYGGDGGTLLYKVAAPTQLPGHTTTECLCWRALHRGLFRLLASCCRPATPHPLTH
jgi:hypothetical protein